VIFLAKSGKEGKEMGLKKSKMQKELYDTMLAADTDVAKQLGVAISDLDTGQKRAMRWSHAKAMGNYLYTMLTTQAEVDLDKQGPNHGIPASTTGPGGGPPHVHPTNQGPITHKKGNFIV